MKPVGIGIMQGRLTDAPNSKDLDWFPIKDWEVEFSVARDLSFNSIELVVDRKKRKDNPIWSQVGRSRIKELYNEFELLPLTCCVNFIIDYSLSCDTTVNSVKDVISYVSDLGFNYIVIPLFGASDIEYGSDGGINKNISMLANYAKDENVKLLIETNLSGDETLNYLLKVESKEVGIVYDVGNATDCDHNIEHDLDVLSGVISHIHIKDKDLFGENVPLGEGIVDFSRFFDKLKNNKYKGAFTLETSRGLSAISAATNNLNYIKEFFNA